MMVLPMYWAEIVGAVGQTKHLGMHTLPTLSRTATPAGIMVKIFRKASYPAYILMVRLRVTCSMLQQLEAAVDATITYDDPVY